MAHQAKGSKTQIIYDTEDTFKATPTTPDAMILPFVSESFRLSQNLIDSKTIRASRNPQQPVKGNMEISGDITIELAPSYGRLFKHLLGGYTVTGTNPYTHTFTVADLPEGMVIEKQFTDLDTPEYFKYNGCKVNNFSMTVKPEGFIESRFGFMGAKETIGTVSFDASPTDLGHTPFGGFYASINEGGSALGVVTQIEITIDNALDGNTYVIDGTGERYSLPEGVVVVSGALTALFTDLTQYTKAVNSTETSLVITLIKGTGAGTLTNEKLTITIDELLFKQQAPVIPGPSGIVIELPFVGYYNDGASASGIKFALNSATASYT